MKSGTGDTVIGHQLLGERLVARHYQPTRVAARVLQPQKLEVAHDVLVECRDAGKRLHEVEDEMRLERFNSLTDSGQVVVDAEHVDLVRTFPQRFDDVVLHLPLGLEDVDAGGVVRRDEVVVHEGEDASLLHRTMRCPPLCR